jgi:hypothetical protein
MPETPLYPAPKSVVTALAGFELGELQGWGVAGFGRPGSAPFPASVEGTTPASGRDLANSGRAGCRPQPPGGRTGIPAIFR